MNLTEHAQEAYNEYTRVGGDQHGYEASAWPNDKHLWIRAYYAGRLYSLNRVLYEFGLPQVGWETDFSALDKAYAEYVQ